MGLAECSRFSRTWDEPVIPKGLCNVVVGVKGCYCFVSCESHYVAGGECDQFTLVENRKGLYIPFNVTSPPMKMEEVTKTIGVKRRDGYGREMLYSSSKRCMSSEPWDEECNRRA